MCQYEGQVFESPGQPNDYNEPRVLTEMKIELRELSSTSLVPGYLYLALPYRQSSSKTDLYFNTLGMPGWFRNRETIQLNEGDVHIRRNIDHDPYQRHFSRIYYS